MEKGAATMKRLFLELGGKSATIVLEDADLSLACMIGIAPCMHAGQGCAIPTRMLLPRSRYDEGVADPQGDVRIRRRRRSAGSGDAVRPGDLGQAAHARPRLHPERHRRGCQAPRRRHRRTRRARQGVLGQAHPVRRRRQRHDDRPGGDLRSGPRRHPVRGRGGRDPHRQRQHLRAGRQRHVGFVGALPGRRPPAASGLHRCQWRRRPMAPTCRSAATRPAASAARTAMPGSINTPSSSPSPTPLLEGATACSCSTISRISEPSSRRRR